VQGLDRAIEVVAGRAQDERVRSGVGELAQVVAVLLGRPAPLDEPGLGSVHLDGEGGPVTVERCRRIADLLDPGRQFGDGGAVTSAGS
jgi:hypothetical protein